MLAGAVVPDRETGAMAVRTLLHVGMDVAEAGLPAELEHHFWVGPDQLDRKMAAELFGVSQEIA